MQAVSPRVVLVPLQIGLLGVQLQHYFASKYLLDILKSLWFCLSYEVSKFVQFAEEYM